MLHLYPLVERDPRKRTKYQRRPWKFSWLELLGVCTRVCSRNNVRRQKYGQWRTYTRASEVVSVGAIFPVFISGASDKELK